MGAVFSQQEDIPCKNLPFLPRWTPTATPPFWEFDGFSICSGPGGNKYIERPNAFEPSVPTQNIPPLKIYFYDVILPLIWSDYSGVSVLAFLRPEDHDPREAQWGHQRAFGAGSTMDCPYSLIEIKNQLRETSCGAPWITAIREVRPWEIGC